MTAIPIAEVLRYLGAAGSEDAALLAEIKEVCGAMEARITPRCIWRAFPCQVNEESVSFGGVTLAGADFARHLAGCTELLLFAATLGPEADRMARAEALRSMARGAIVHAAGAAMIEQFCDDQQEALA